MTSAVDIGGVLHHRGPEPDAGDALGRIGGQHGTIVEHHEGPIWIAARRPTGGTRSGPTDVIVEVVGRIDNRSALDNALGTRNESIASCVGAAYQRFGTDCGARLFGPWAAVIWDGAHRRLVLLRAAGAGGIPSLHFVRDGQRTIFSTRLAHVRTSAWAAEDLIEWATGGRWPSAERGPYREVEAVAPGQAVVVTDKGRTSRHRVWSFVPLVIPRELSADAARAELDDTLRARLDGLRRPVKVVGEAHVAAHLAELVPHPPATVVTTLVSQDPHALLRAARSVELPIPLTRLLTLAKLMWNPGADLVVDWGAREALGGTMAGLRAWVRSIARAIDATPRPGTFVKVARLAWPVDRRLGEPQLHRHVVDVTRNVAHRWSAQLPSFARRRLVPLLEGPAATDERGGPEPVTGDVFTDIRFSQVTDASLAAAHTALTHLAQNHGRRAVAPFLSAEAIELVFALPARYFVQDCHAMWILGGGVEVAPVVTAPRPESLAMRVDDWIQSAKEEIGVEPPVGASLEVLDRWYGLAAFLESRRH